MNRWHVFVLALLAGACTAGASGGVVSGLVVALVLFLTFASSCGSGGAGCLGVGPCLEPVELPPPDTGGPADADDGGAAVRDLGRDLDPNADADATNGDTSPEMGQHGVAPTRRDVLEKYRDRLPDDVVARLHDEDVSRTS